jgi:isoamylase
VRRSQGGNNNTWCQNNPLGWMHWLPDPVDQALRTYLRRLLQLRRRLAPLLNPELATLERHWHGVECNKPDWASWSHTLAWSLQEPQGPPLLWCGLNAYAKAIHFELPVQPNGWMRVIDTGLPAGEELPARPTPWSPEGIPLESRSLVLLASRGVADQLQLDGEGLPPGAPLAGG